MSVKNTNCPWGETGIKISEEYQIFSVKFGQLLTNLNKYIIHIPIDNTFKFIYALGVT